MHAKFKTRAMLMFVLSIFFVLAVRVTLAHDPLSDEHHAQHDDPHSAHELSPQRPQRVDLNDVRARVISFRVTGDDRHLDDAWELLEPALALSTPDPETLVTASFVAQSRHEFDFAMRLISRALEIDRTNDEGWLLLASIQLVLGDTEAADMACGQLRSVVLLVSMTCNARVALATGDHEIALKRLGGMLKIAASQHLSPDVLAWSYSVAGDLAVASAAPEQALMYYTHSLNIAERTQVRSALVDVLLSQADYETASQVLDDGSLALPLLVRRLIVARQLDRLEELQPVLTKVEQEFAAWIAKEDWLHAREMARFFIDVIDRPDLARRLALINIDLQKEPEDLRLEVRTRPLQVRSESGRSR